MDLGKIKVQLIEKRGELVEKGNRIKSHIRNEHDVISRNFEDQATERENDEVLDALDDTVREELGKIDKALFRLDKGSYGICAVCGKSIGDQRLAALPYATRCINCASQ